MEVIEEFINGFCKAQNQSRMVICEFREEADGTRTFLDSDCGHSICPHSRECLLMGKILDRKGPTLDNPCVP